MPSTFAPPHASAASRDALESALAGLDLSWSVLGGLAFGAPPDEVSIDFIALHPRRGIALIDAAPADTSDTVARFRAFLAAERFDRHYPGWLPIIHLRLSADEADEIGNRLEATFSRAPPITVRDARWVHALADLLTSEPESLLQAAPSERQRDPFEPGAAFARAADQARRPQRRPALRSRARRSGVSAAALALLLGAGVGATAVHWSGKADVLAYLTSRSAPEEVSLADRDSGTPRDSGTTAETTASAPAPVEPPPAATGPNPPAQVTPPSPPAEKPPTETAAPPLPPAPPPPKAVVTAKPPAPPPPAPPPPAPAAPDVAAVPAPTPSPPPPVTKEALATAQPAPAEKMPPIPTPKPNFAPPEPPPAVAKAPEPEPKAEPAPRAVAKAPEPAPKPAPEPEAKPQPAPRAVAKAPEPAPKAAPEPPQTASRQPDAAPEPPSRQAATRSGGPIPLRPGSSIPRVGPPIDATDLPPLGDASPRTDEPPAQDSAFRRDAPRVAAGSGSGGGAVTNASSAECRPYVADTTITGASRPVSGLACRQPDGRWKLVTERPQ